jgi:hypothetical protein
MRDERIQLRFGHYKPLSNPGNGIAWGSNPSGELLREITDALSASIEYKDWKALGAWLPPTIRIFGCEEMSERALQDLESHLANAHDIELRLLNHSQDSSLFHDKRFRCFTRVSWVDDDTWQCAGVELELHLGARIEKRKWNVTAMDAYDSLIARGLDCILPTFLAQGTPLLFSAEANCFPASPGQTIHDYPVSPTKYRFLNSGGFMGRIDYLLQLMRDWKVPLCADNGIDQQWWAHLYLSGRTLIKLDHRCEVFQCLFMRQNDVKIRSGEIWNCVTRSNPCVVHANDWCGMDSVRDHILNGSRWPWYKRFTDVVALIESGSSSRAENGMECKEGPTPLMKSAA